MRPVTQWCDGCRGRPSNARVASVHRAPASHGGGIGLGSGSANGTPRSKPTLGRNIVQQDDETFRIRQVRGRSFRFPENRSKIGLAAENRSTNPWPAEKPLRTRKNVQPHGETFKNMAIRGKSFNEALAGQKSPRTRKNVQPYGETFKKGLSAGKRSKVHIWTLRSASARPAAPTGILASVPRRSARPW